MKIASFLAMTTILIAHGRNRGRQHKNNCHCEEEERRGNLPHFYTPSTACTQILLVLPVLLWLGTGCRPQSKSDRRDAPLDTMERMNVPAPGRPDRFGHALSHTVLNFHLDDCRSTLHAVNRAMDNLTPRTQQDYWESTKQRFHEHKGLYAQLCEDWAGGSGKDAAGDGNAERLRIQAKLAELEQMFQETGQRIEERDRDYTQTRRQYEWQKRQYFDGLLVDRGKPESTEQGFYKDGQIRMGVSAVDVTAKHVLVTLEVYSNEGMQQTPEDLPLSASRHSVSSVQGIERYVSLADQHGQGYGAVLEIEYDRLHFLGGLIVTLAYAQNPKSNERPAKLEIKSSPLGNKESIALAIPFDQDRDRLVNGLEMEDLVGPAQVNATGPVGAGTKVIHCRRAGMHLKVPVRLDIHGVEVKCSMLLDTGASLTVLAKSVYNRGLARPLGSLRSIRLKTANGPMTCALDTLRVITVAYSRTIPVALTNDSMSLLGANYFAGYRITIDLDRECIYVHPAEKQ
jgi:hypothetical protein